MGVFLESKRVIKQQVLDTYSLKYLKYRRIGNR